MNRIYQGRVSAVEIDRGDSKQPDWHQLDKSEWERRLWHHHSVFQDAINYYLVALASLADSEHAPSRLIKDLKGRIESAWHEFPRPMCPDAKGLRQSLTPWLGLSRQATPEEAYAAILENNQTENEVRTLALSLLLERCGGEAAIQQGGRGYFPRFCDADASPTWDFSAEAVQTGIGKDRLAQALHGTTNQQALEELADELELSWTVKVQPSKYYSIEESIDRLKEAVSHIKDFIRTAPNARVEAFIAEYPDYEVTFDSYNERITDLSWTQLIPRNRKASKELTFATLLFKYFPNDLTARVLSLFIKKPTSSSPETGDENLNFASLGDDPIKLAREKRGYVFRAFTALSAWNPSSPGKPAWKEFDIAAFKEALKSLNQFNQKTNEREAKEKDLHGQMAILLGGEVKGWKRQKTDSEEEDSTLKPLDPRLFALARELERKLTEELDDTTLGEEQTQVFGNVSYTWREGEWQITSAALRGLNHIVDEWEKVYNKHNGQPPASLLVDVVKRHQSDDKNRKSIGSVPLFLHLCEKPFWPLWLRGDNNSDEDSGNSGFFIKKMPDFHNTLRDWQRAQDAVNLTPAEPEHSRRLYMFSDIKDKLARVVYGTGPDANNVTCAIAYESNEQQISEVRIRLHYSAKRLLRDELQGGTESRWLQPMTLALGLALPKPEEKAIFDSALSLMPDPLHTKKGEEPRCRFLLNFPVTLDPSWIHNGLGRKPIWQGQFNGIKDKNLHLHWPETIKGKASESPWWRNQNIINSGLTTIAVDLGQRAAGAFALLRVTCNDPRKGKNATKRPVREIGFDGERHWFAEVVTTGMLRLPGEGIETPDNFGATRSKKYDKQGRPASEEEWKHAKELARSLQADTPENWVGKLPTEKRFPEQNDALIVLANQRLTRLNTFHRWSCFDPDRSEVADRRDAMINKLIDELSHWKDPAIQFWKLCLEKESFSEFRKNAGDGFLKLRESLGQELVKLANRSVPLRGRSWEWRPRKDSTKYRELMDTGPQLNENKAWIRGQRGLSLARIEQLENLRRLFLRLNRSYDRNPGQKADFGPADGGRDSGEPCHLLLGKIDRMKEQRINQTAHLILAEALGVQLKPHEIDPEERCKRDIHGEYQPIPGRHPVDFIVIENLDRYLTSQGRAPSENSRLMKWAHRAIREKIKMLAEEPFGITVVEAPAAYSSRFCAKTGAPGFRCEERSELNEYLRGLLQRNVDRSNRPGQPNQSDYTTILNQFTQLEKINSARRKAGEMVHSLLLPKPGGPLFLPLNSGKTSQADLNAAINLGLRAIAAPRALHLIHKIRTERAGNNEGTFIPIQKNVREQVAFKSKPEIILTTKATEKLTKASSPNFFYNHQNNIQLDSGSVNLDGQSIPVASGIGLWSTVNQQTFAAVAKINRKRLERWSLVIDDKDNILM